MEFDHVDRPGGGRPGVDATAPRRLDARHPALSNSGALARMAEIQFYIYIILYNEYDDL